MILKDPRIGVEVAPKVFILDHFFRCQVGSNPCQKGKELVQLLLPSSSTITFPASPECLGEAGGEDWC